MNKFHSNHTTIKEVRKIIKIRQTVPLIGGKGDLLMKVDVSVYCRLLCRPEEIEEKPKLAFSWLG